MAVIAQDNQRLSNLIKYELFPEYRHCRDVIVYNGAAKSFAIGDLVAADGTTPATAGAIAGIVVTPTSAVLNTDTQVVVLARGDAGVSTAGLKLGSLVLADVKAALLAKNIKVLTAV